MANCPACNTVNADTASFCRSCGKPMASAPAPQAADGSISCPACGQPNRAGAKFCAKCGAGLAQTAPAPGSAANEPAALSSGPVRETPPRSDPASRTPEGPARPASAPFVVSPQPANPAVTWVVLGVFVAVAIAAAGGVLWWTNRDETPIAADAPPPPVTAPAPTSKPPLADAPVTEPPPLPPREPPSAETPSAPGFATPPVFDPTRPAEVTPPPAGQPSEPPVSTLPSTPPPPTQQPADRAREDVPRPPGMDAERDARMRAEEQRRREQAARKEADEQRRREQAARKEAEAQRQRAAPSPPPAASYSDEAPRVQPARRLVEDICAKRFADNPARREKCEWNQCRQPEHEHEALCRRLYGGR